jgi:arylformamidase
VLVTRQNPRVELIDVTVPIREGMVTYPGDPVVQTQLHSAIGRGDDVNLTRLDFGVHSGTHIDAPVHFLEGCHGVDAWPLDALVGPAAVVYARAVEGVLDRETLEGLAIPDVPRLLFRTSNSELWERSTFAHDFVHFVGSGAEVLVERGVRLVGIDYLSIGDEDAHKVLLGAGIVVVEGLDLRQAGPGEYELLCLPMKIEGADGAPARVVLRRSAG